MQTEAQMNPSWLDKPLFRDRILRWETVVFIVILLLAIISRFYDLESRVMSHDENTHVFYSWRFYRGEGLSHDPLMHGPFQFHLVALSYFAFGDNDFTARIPGALFSIATVGFMWFYRRYLGKAGMLVAALLFLISPYLLYYGRYVRNETYAAFFGVVSLWAILRYLDTGKTKYTYWLTAVTVLHFTAKETSFIYTAQALVFLALYFVFRISRMSWRRYDFRIYFLISLMVALMLLAGAAGYVLLSSPPADISATETVEPSVPGQELHPLEDQGPAPLPLILGSIGVFSLLAAAYFLFSGYGWQNIRTDRAFALVMILGTLVLPQLAAFPMRFAGITVPTSATQVMNLQMFDYYRMAAFVVPLILVSIVIGLVWDWRLWLANAAIWYALFTLFYTSVFTNGAGFFSGLVGSLGYWLEQQGVERGSQPWYYYAFVQVPVYEYLPLLGTFLALWVATARQFILGRSQKSETSINPHSNENIPAHAEYNEQLSTALDNSNEPDELGKVAKIEGTENDEFVEINETPHNEALVDDLEMTQDELADDTLVQPSYTPPVFSFFFFWSVTSLAAYTIAGEKMPWLTVHIAFPMILTAAWGLGQLIDAVDWRLFRERRGWLVLIVLAVFVLSTLSVLGALLGPNPPFKSMDLQGLRSTATFLVSLVSAVISGAGIFYLIKPWPTKQFTRIVILFLFSLLAFLTARVAFTAAYINFDYANELLVYAHSAPGVKVAMGQIEEISRRTTDGLAVQVAYDSETSYPYWWYLRNYPNQRFFGDNPTRSLREVPMILVGDANFGKIEQVVGGLYDQFDYIRLWWPNQDYYGLTWERVWNAFTDPNMRAAILQIWLNRDYSKYSEVVGRDMSAPNWSPSDRMRLYIRKDIVNQLWNYGAAPSAQVIETSIWDGKEMTLTADMVFGSIGSADGQFQMPRDLSVAQDGSIFVVDSDNHRIQHLNPDGTVIRLWGSFGDAVSGEASGGQFNQPWGIDLGPDGSVYVADTWNHRIQKFTAEGEFVTMWGIFGQGETPFAFWGPRDVAVGPDGKVYVTDTGNKRIVAFDSDGNFLTQFGGPGLSPGQFDEPVGIFADALGQVYVADTWNQRIQKFIESGDGGYQAEKVWDVDAWYGQSLDNKPYLSVDIDGRVYVSDPDGYRILVFSSDGEALYYWGDFGVGLDAFGLPASVAVDGAGGVWVTDSANGRVMHFTLPGP